MINISQIASQGKVYIESPKELAEILGNKPLDASFSNFGHIPYGYSTKGRLYYDIYNQKGDYACEPLTTLTLEPEAKEDRYPIVLLDRGNCSFVTKSRHVQNLGGHIALIINNNSEDVRDIVMVDDGTGQDIWIQAVLISQRDGDKIKDFIRQNKDNPQVLSKLIVSVEYEMPKTNIVEYSIFFSSENKKVYELMKEFLPYHQLLSNYTKFVPHYISHMSPLYNQTNPKPIANCLANGLYCHGPRYDLGITDGKEILMEDIRQKCTWRLAYLNPEANKDQYWNYMTNFYERCVNTTSPSFDYKCSTEVAESVGIKFSDIEKCMVQSFKLDRYSELVYTNNNTLLEDDYDIRKKYEIRVFPTIMVNNKTIHSAWNAEDLFEAICTGFKNKPDVCSKITDNSVDGDLSFGFIFIIILIVVALNIGIIYICKNYIAQRIHDRVDNVDINSRINNVVTSYLALRDQK